MRGKKKNPSNGNPSALSDFLVTEKVASLILGLAPGTLANMRTHNRGPCYRKLGKAVRYAPSELTRWADMHKVTPET